MSEITNTAQTSVIEEDTQVAQTAVSNQENEQEVNEVEFTDSQTEESEKQNPTQNNKDDEKKTQSQELNAQYARKRREEEQERIKHAKSEAKKDAIIEINNGINPYTQEKMTDDIDVQEYLTMREIEKNGGDPIRDYHRVISERSKKEQNEVAQEKQRQQWLDDDREKFFNEIPEAEEKMPELIKNPDFIEYSKDKIGVIPMTDIYKGFMKQEQRIEELASKRAQEMFAKSKATPGSLTSNETSKSTSFEDMSDEDFEAFTQKIKRGGK